MKAKTTGKRLVILTKGTQLVPTHEAVQLKDGEADHAFTKYLVENGEVVLSGAPIEQVEHPTPSPIDNTESTLRDALGKKKKTELLKLCEEFGIETSDRDTNPQLIDKLVAHELGQ